MYGNHDINIIGSLNIFFNIVFAFSVINIVKDRFKIYFTNIIYYLASISIVLFTFQILIPTPFFSLNRILQDIFPSLDIYGKSYSNSIVYTFRSPHWYRNCGFMWEPGGFGAILSVALFFAIELNKFRISKKSIVLILAIVTTFSTTAYLNIGIVVIFIIFNIKERLHLLWFLPLMFVFFIYMYNLDFIGEKLNTKLNSTQTEIDQIDSPYAINQDVIPLDRFSSLIIQFQIVKNNILFGVGLQEDSFNGIKLNLSNGLGDYFVKYGIVGLIFLLFNLFKSSISFNMRNAKGYYIYIVIIVTIGFSNPLLLTPLFFLFQLYYLK